MSGIHGRIELAHPCSRRGFRRAGHPAVLDAGHLLHQRFEPGAVLRHLRARPEHPGRVRRPRLARPRRPVRHHSLCHGLPALDGIWPHHGDPRRAGHQSGLHRRFRGAGAARHRHRLHHDHACARPDHLGPGLPLDQPHRRRQRHQRENPAVAIRPRPRRSERILLHVARHFPDRCRRRHDLRALAVRRGAARAPATSRAA